MTDQAKPLDILICQDATETHSSAREVARFLGEQGYKINVSCVDDRDALNRYLARLKADQPAPDAIFMDVGGVGEPAALDAIRWFDQKRPGEPLPFCCFMSLATGASVTEAISLRHTDPRVKADFIDTSELSWLAWHLQGRPKLEYGEYLPESATLREWLNTRLGTNLPVEHKVSEYNEKRIEKLKGITNDRVLPAWQKGRLTAEEAIERLRPYATGVAGALREGLYGAARDGAGGLEPDAQFYAGTGFPARGKAVFTLDEARNVPEGGPKPVLFMQSYDPAVVPLLVGGYLGGLVVTAPYMASHLKLLCETHLVSGLFGLIPPGKKSLMSEFNEEARPEGPPYFPGGETVIADKTVKAGQEVLVGVGGGLVAAPPPAAPGAAGAAVNEEKLAAELKILEGFDKCFEAFFSSHFTKHHGVKANVDSADPTLLGKVRGIGLVRTEQMAAANAREVADLKDYLLRGDEAARDWFLAAVESDYGRFASCLSDGKALKVRLFDFVHREILDKDEQRLFTDKYGKLDFHGGEALDKWPDLYRGQVRAVLTALGPSGGTAGAPLEIMMPAVRTEDDVLRIKAIVDEEAKNLDIDPSRYSFGVMAETLEACKNIGAIAKHCDFISFGTNDLTSEYFEMSRADLKAHAGFAAKNGYDPFKKLAPEILDLVRRTVDEGRVANRNLRVDVCGAQAADPAAARALFAVGVDNVSVAPTPVNLHALPLELGYAFFDDVKAREAARAQTRAAAFREAAEAVTQPTAREGAIRRIGNFFSNLLR